MTRVLVVDSLRAFLEREKLPADIDVELFSEAAGPPAGTYAGIVPVVTTRIGAGEMDRLRGLRVIANYGVGYDNIDIAATKARGIVVSNTPGVLTGATAELTWALILAVARRIGGGERLARSGKWRGWQPTQLLGSSLEQRTLGIVGAGRIGREVGRRAPAFGMNVVYWSRTRHEEWERECGARWLELHELLPGSDVVSVHLSLSPETEKLIDADALACMRDDAILINAARGAIVDEPALIAELRSGRLRAGLDVYENEPRIPSELLALDNVVLLPHLGSATREARTGMWQLAWKNLLLGVAGKRLANPI